MGEPNWRNRTIWTRDNLHVLRGLNSGTVDLIYLDPPFNSNRTYSAPIGSKAAGAAFKDAWTFDDADRVYLALLQERDPTAFAIIEAARQAHGKGMAAYIGMMAQRLVEMRRVLKDSGSIYLHCDPTAGAYLKMLMDGIFGASAFQNEIVWKRTGSHNRAKRWGPVHDCILYYARGGGQPVWNRVLQPLDREYVERFYRYADDRGKFMVDNLTGSGLRDGDTGQPWRDVDPSERGRHWAIPAERALPGWFVAPHGYSAMTTRARLEILHEQGLIYWPPKGEMPRFKRYLTADSGLPVTDMVLDIPPLSAGAKERTGYPTQKPLALLDRIIRASSNEGDVVLDPFCGCATAAVSAERLQRQWIGVDVSPKAAELVTTRLQDILEEVPLYKTGDVVHRTDQPGRTDLGDLPPYRSHLDALYGRQEGLCGGCGEHFRKRNMTVDHIVARAHGGTDLIENLWLLCGACNSSKGTRSQEQFLKERMQKRAALFPWLVS